MASLAPKTLKRIQDLWARMMDPSSDQESATVRAVLIALLKKNSRTWHDLPKIMAEIEMEKAAAEAAAAAATRAAGWKKGPDGDDLGIPGNDLLGLLLALTESYLWVPDEERMAFVLWALHTQVCRQFPFTPRLLFISPIENCGKTTALKILEQLAYEPDLTKNTTAAAIYLLLEQAPGTTLLIDEADNQNLFNDPKMRSLFNGGYEHGSISRGSGGRSQKFNVGAPLALGTIQALPRPLMSRSIAIHMRRSPIELKILDVNTDPAFRIAREAIQKWAARCTLSREPEMPEGFHGRLANNWRPLLSIADDLDHGRYGDLARAAAIALNSSRQYENPYVTLLTNIRTVFDRYGTDRLCTKRELIPGLAGLEDSLWAEWAGLDDMAAPHMLTQGDLGRLLRPFGIRSKTLWPPRRDAETKSESGYYRSQFEAAWVSYCEPSATPPQASKVQTS